MWQVKCSLPRRNIIEARVVHPVIHCCLISPHEVVARFSFGLPLRIAPGFTLTSYRLTTAEIDTSRVTTPPRRYASKSL